MIIFFLENEEVIIRSELKVTDFFHFTKQTSTQN